MSLTVLGLVQQTSDALGLPRPATVEDGTDTNTQRVLACLQLAAEEAAAGYNWLALKRITAFDATTTNPAYVPAEGGYSIPLLTQDVYVVPTDDPPPPIPVVYMDNTFARFSSNYLYNLTKGTYIPEVSGDETMNAQEMVQGGQQVRTTFWRMGDFLMFTPQPPGDKIAFLYQGSFVAWRVVDGVRHACATFELDTDMPALDTALLKRGGIVQYNQQRGLDNDKYILDYNKYLGFIKDTQAPAGVRVSPRQMGAIYG